MNEPEINYYGDKRWYNSKEQLHREDGPAIEYSNGSKEWYVNGKRHRENGPAYEGTTGTKYWCINGRYHREDGPAIVLSDGTKSWYINGNLLNEEEFNKKMNKPEIDDHDNKMWKNSNGQYHREDGPAYEGANGHKSWWINGKRHREDGPAYEGANGDKEWWINGEEMNEKQFNKKISKKSKKLKTLNDYQKFTAKVCMGHTRKDCNGDLKLISHELAYNAIGLGEEAGESLGKIKKAIRQGNMDMFVNEFEKYPEQKKKFLLELGDALYYLCRCANMVGSSLKEVANLNKEKLEDRSERGVIKGEGDDR